MLLARGTPFPAAEELFPEAADPPAAAPGLLLPSLLLKRFPTALKVPLTKFPMLLTVSAAVLAGFVAVVPPPEILLR